MQNLRLLKKKHTLGKRQSKAALFAIVHNVRSLHNVGSIFRTADAAGVSHIYLTGYTPAPVDRFGIGRKEITKTALGAERFMKWEKAADIKKLIARLQKMGVAVLALEQGKHAADYRSITVKGPLALIVGNEVRGLSPLLLKHCDAVIEIPMRGKKESLNVSVAFGIATFALIGRYK